MSAVVGETAAKALDGLQDGEEVLACALVIVIDDGDGTITRVHFSSENRYEQLGLLASADEAMEHGDDAP